MDGIFLGADMTLASPQTPRLALPFRAPVGDHPKGQYLLLHKHCAEEMFITLTRVSRPTINLLYYSFSCSHRGLHFTTPRLQCPHFKTLCISIRSPKAQVRRGFSPGNQGDFTVAANLPLHSKHPKFVLFSSKTLIK